MRLQVRRMVHEDAAGIGPEDVVSFQGNARPITSLPSEATTPKADPWHVPGCLRQLQREWFGLCRYGGTTMVTIGILHPVYSSTVRLSNSKNSPHTAIRLLQSQAGAGECRTRAAASSSLAA